MVIIVALKVFRTITHNTYIDTRAMLGCVYTLMECPSAWCKNKTRPKNFYRDNRHLMIAESLTQITPNSEREKGPW